MDEEKIYIDEIGASVWTIAATLDPIIEGAVRHHEIAAIMIACLASASKVAFGAKISAADCQGIMVNFAEEIPHMFEVMTRAAAQKEEGAAS